MKGRWVGGGGLGGGDDDACGKWKVERREGKEGVRLRERGKRKRDEEIGVERAHQT